ncbi:MAG: transglutaminase family protein [Paracoccaceae bacterium]
MILTVRHETRYTYDTPLSRLLQCHRLWPADGAAQRVRDWRVTATGRAGPDAAPAEAPVGCDWVEGNGDRVTMVALAGPVTEATVNVEGTVETADTQGVQSGRAREVLRPSAYLRRTEITRADQGLRDLAFGIDASGVALGHALTRAVAEAIRYTPGATDAGVTAAQALEAGAGVCQDHAHALIACATLRGMPARYVTGYLVTDGAGAAHDASHAWAELWIEDLGWTGFDPANGKSPDAGYVRLGSGLDAGLAAPIRGVASGGGHEALTTSVQVREADQ